MSSTSTSSRFSSAREFHSSRRAIGMCRCACAHRGSTRTESFASAMKSRGSFAALVLTAVLATDAAGAQSQGTSPERTVSRNVVTSEQDPKVRIELPASAQYIGGDRWVLYGIADCELHAFVEPDKQKNVQRLYWIQFEGYLPTRPELHHRYDSVRHTHIGGLDFYVDTWMSRSDAKDEPGSDSEHIQTLIRSKGYRMPAAM